MTKDGDVSGPGPIDCAAVARQQADALAALMAMAVRAAGGAAAVLCAPGGGDVFARAGADADVAALLAHGGDGFAHAPVRCGDVQVAELRTSGPSAAWAAEAFAAQAMTLLELQHDLSFERATRASLQRQLERADRLVTVGRLAAGIAHELGTPLAVVAGRARQLAAGTVPAEQAQAAARTIADQADRMTAIIRQLLDFARRREPRLGRFDVRLLLRQAVALLEQVAQRKNVRLTLADMPVVRVLQFDGSQMMQVMTNLLMNAVQASPAGGEVTVSLSEADLAPPPDTGLAPGRYVQVRVSDAGPGVSKEDQLRIFEPFFTTKDTGEGTGLGLSVAQGIVRDHEGWLAVESDVGQGSTFIVHLPG